MFSIFKKYSALSLFFSEKRDGSMKLTDKPVLAKKIFRHRNKFFRKNMIDPQKIVSAGIAHGNRIVITDANDEGKIMPNADGLITQHKNIYLSITSADCLPIFLFEPDAKIIGMIHAGWKSLEKDIFSKAVENILLLGGRAEKILVGIGPAICQKHYEVGPEVAEKFSKYPKAIQQADALFLDIKKVAQLQLSKLGLKNENIEISPECTFELPAKYFSARRDKPESVEVMAAVIGMKNI